MSFPTPDREILLAWGEEVTYKPDGEDPETVTVVRAEVPDAMRPGASLALFGTMELSEFSKIPDENEGFTVDGVEYRVYSRKVDTVGGNEATAGIHLYLTLA
jgi:hypothetical protein